MFLSLSGVVSSVAEGRLSAFGDDVHLYRNISWGDCGDV